MLVGDAKNGSPTFLFAFGNNIAVDTGSVEIQVWVIFYLYDYFLSGIIYEK